MRWLASICGSICSRWKNKQLSAVFPQTAQLTTCRSNLTAMLQLAQTFHASAIVDSRWCVDRPYASPFQDLQAELSGSQSLLPDEDMVFRPTEAEVEGTQKIFQPPKGKTIVAHKGVVDLKDLPPASLPEVCFIGRSNVGKSSLIKALFFNTRDTERITVSSKPGHTKTLKFYSITKRFSLVDMPGYGFNMPDHYVQSAEKYIQTRPSLQMMFLLLDASVGITSTDEIGINMLEETGKPYTIVLTKIDKTSHSRVLTNLLKVQSFRREHLVSAFPQPFLVSARAGAGLAYLRTLVAYVTGNVRLQGM